MKTPHIIILCLALFILGLFIGVVLYSFQLLPPHPYNIIYELPNGGYIFHDDYPLKYGGEVIRYNENSYNGTLDYQITLNPLEIK